MSTVEVIAVRASVRRIIVALIVLSATAVAASAADWPMWRFDAQRRGVTPEGLSEELHLQWVRELSEPRRAWPFQWDDAGKLDFDVSYEPVAAGTTLLVGSMVSDSVTAYDTRTGSELWRFYTNGPVRFAPTVHEERVYVGSDDGSLYCLALDTGELVWRFQAAPRERYLLGNERMINIWAVRGAPVVRDGTIYFTAGVFPFMGTFIYALDAETGAIEWVNSGTGSMYNLHQHSGAYSFGGVAPQGYLVATDELLLIPGGRTPPAAYDRQTGDFVYFRQATSHVGKGAGGYAVWAQGGWFHNPNMANRFLYALEDGAQFGELPADVVCDEHLLGLQGQKLVAYGSEPKVTEAEVTDRLGRGQIQKKYEFEQLFRTEMDIELSEIHIQAGDRVYASHHDGLIAAIDLPGPDEPARVSWQATIDGTPWSMIAADDRLFVVTEEGRIFCFGRGETEPEQHIVSSSLDRPHDHWARRAAAMLKATDTGGFALMLGAGSGHLLYELVEQSKLHVIVVEPNATRVRQMRRQFDDAGYYGRRVAVLEADLEQIKLAPYFASLITAEDLTALRSALNGAEQANNAEQIFDMLRPYGGAAWLPVPADEHEAMAELLDTADIAGAQLTRVQDYTTITRSGPLPGAGQWTHQYADSANSGLSWDSLVRAPLGLLWYGGGYNNHNALPRHQNGPVPQVVGGRLFIMGPDTISARDVYTGRELWIVDLPGVGHAFTSLEHEKQLAAGQHPYFPNQPGANFVGSNYVSVEDGVYVVHEGRCLRLDPATGEVMNEFSVPAGDGGDAQMGWGFVIYDDLLVTGADPQIFDDSPIGDAKSWNATSSERIVVMDRYTGEVLWQVEAKIGFRHNAIIASAGNVFLIDGLPEHQLEMLQRRGRLPDTQARVVALDARSGERLWSYNSKTFGTWLSHSEEHDVLIEAGRYGARETLPDEPRERMIAHRGTTGKVLWERSTRYSGPIAMRGEQIITGREEPAIDLLTAENIMRRHPLTGQDIPWRFTRKKGCGTQNVSEHLITFRSGAAGYYDLARGGGTGNFGGFRAGCTNNLVVADGVLNAPDYTRSCFCSYQLQTSVGLVHMPDVEMWTYLDIERGAGVLQRAGINFGAPGGRFDDAGTWWLEYPFSTNSPLEVPVQMSGTDSAQSEKSAAVSEPETFVHHSSWVDDPGVGMDWVAASGVEGAISLQVGLAPQGENAESRAYTVRLHFIEPGEAAPAQRQFAVRVQDREVISGLDVGTEAGGARRALVQEITGVEAADELHLVLAPAESALYPPVLCGIEILHEDGAQTAAEHNRADASCRWASGAPAWAAQLAAALRLRQLIAWLN